jgi:GNAT superfamily N-acetyltransferase
MEIRRLCSDDIGELWKLHLLYKEAIGEETPDGSALNALKAAMEEERILFFGAWAGGKLAGCCSASLGFSTFNYAPCAVFEDFFILPEYRRRGIARALVEAAYRGSGAASMTVCCADCDIEMYKALGFTARLGNLLAFG